MITEFEVLDLNNQIYVLRDFNINLLIRNKYLLNKPNGTNQINKDFFQNIKIYK